MLKDFQALVARASDTILEDLLGAAALTVMLIAALHLPSML